MGLYTNQRKLDGPSRFQSELHVHAWSLEKTAEYSRLHN